MIPPIYILITVAFPDIKSRARYFGVVSGAGGLGAAAGPLIGGLITSAISWRASFGLQVLVVALDHRAGPQDHRPGEAGTGAAFRPDRSDPVGGRAVLRRARPAAVQDLRLRRIPAGLHHRRHGRDTQGLDLPGVDLRRDRRAVPALVLPARPGERAEAQGRRCFRCGCSATRSPTSAWAPRSSSG